MNRLDLVGRKVLHFLKGRGVIKSIAEREKHQGDIMVVRFSGGEEGQYLYPQSFESILEIKDKSFSKMIEKDLAEYRKALAEKQKQKESNVPDPPDPPVYPAKNAAFKYTYNDGGIERNEIGFVDICSDDQIWRNIKSGRRWCSNDDCSCKKYFDGKISRRELDRDWSPCYESRMLTDWIAEAGVKYLENGEEKPIKIKNASKDSLAVLTTRLPGALEKERIIFGLFIVGDFYEGDDDTPGYLEAHPEFRLTFSAEEGSKLKFWKYHFNPTNPSRIFWGTGLLRYFPVDEGVQILRDAVSLKKGTADEQLAKRILDYYCKRNYVYAGNIGEPDGALTRM